MAVTGRKPTRARYDPLELETAPEVTDLLNRLGLGTFDVEDVSSHVGRNDNWSGPTTSGARVFVKRLTGPSPEDARRRFERLLAFESLTSRGENDALLGPRFLGSDEESLLVAFELLEDARSGAELTADDSFDEALSLRAGRITGTLHSLPTDSPLLDTSPHPLPATHKLHALPLSAFTAATFGELETWRLIQSDEELLQALDRVRTLESDLQGKCAIHGDMRLDQFLVSGDRLYLTDWEEFRLGDPARDVGAFVGEWLYFAMRGIPKALGEEPGFTFGHQTSHQEILTVGARALDRFQPLMRAFWTGYQATRTTAPDEGFVARAAAYAGWHMFDRMFATGMAGGRVLAADRACAGIGRTVLLAPESYVDVLGLGEIR